MTEQVGSGGRQERAVATRSNDDAHRDRGGCCKVRHNLRDEISKVVGWCCSFKRRQVVKKGSIIME